MVRGERFKQRGDTKSWGPREWGAYRRGYLSGEMLGGQKPAVPSRPSADRLLRVTEVVKLTGLHRSSLWRLERAGDFPKRVRLTSNTVAWRASEVQRWIALRGGR